MQSAGSPKGPFGIIQGQVYLGTVTAQQEPRQWHIWFSEDFLVFPPAQPLLDHDYFKKSQIYILCWFDGGVYARVFFLCKNNCIFYSVLLSTFKHLTEIYLSKNGGINLGQLDPVYQPMWKAFSFGRCSVKNCVLIFETMILSIPPVWLWLHDQMLCIVSHSSSQLLTAIETLCHHIRENRKKREGEACCFCISKGQRQKKKKKTLIPGDQLLMVKW